MALMKYMVGHNASHARELAELAVRLKDAGNPAAYEQVMAAVSDFEKGNLRLSAIWQACSKEERLCAFLLFTAISWRPKPSF